MAKPEFFKIPIETDDSLPSDRQMVKFKHPDGREDVFDMLTGKQVIDANPEGESNG